ncbi:MAG: tetratricopeptide repeat protein [Deltaproteobacteria bacterium]|nr:tetratricopeptide repeat protein [Deltaproteobacteria bacterium]
MAIDRDKVARNALRYIQRGQYEKAAEEYRKLLALDPRDMRARLRLVELYGRMGKRREVVEESERVAEAYADQGFYLKAIAVYKQAVRHDPQNPALWRAMGELYTKQGLVGDALASFKKAVEILRAQNLGAEAPRNCCRAWSRWPRTTRPSRCTWRRCTWTRAGPMPSRRRWGSWRSSSGARAETASSSRSWRGSTSVRESLRWWPGGSPSCWWIWGRRNGPWR